MEKKVVVISSSPRVCGNSEIMAKSFAEGARNAGHKVEVVLLRDICLEFCKGCLACQKTGKCVIGGDVEKVLEKIVSSDVLVLATPVYFYGMSGQLKTLLDRTNPLFGGCYSFRDVYIICSSADSDEKAADGVISGINGWLACFEKARLAGVVRGTGVEGAGEISEDKKNESYQAGKNV